MNKFSERIWGKYIIREETMLNMGLVDSTSIGTQDNKIRGNNFLVVKFINKIRFGISLKVGRWI